jgi:FkbM family methyltransferase
MYAAWVRPQASVLEVGARYGQTSCLLSHVLQPAATSAKVFSVDADPTIWEALETNLAKHSCNARVVKGVMGTKSMKLIENGYGSRVVPKDHPHPGLEIPAHTVDSLNATIDTLAIDCEGCFANFLEENPSLLDSLTMIMAEIHIQREEEVVQKLLNQGWEMKHRLRRQRVLCKGPCEMQCSKHWVQAHAKEYWPAGGKVVEFPVSTHHA